jgi:hypothetical protein
MATITPEILSDEAKRDTRGRKLIAERRWRELVTEYEASGLTQAKFARREGLNYHTFVAWLGRCRRQSRALGPVARFIEARVPAGVAERRRLEVLLPGGVVVRGDDAVALAALVQALRGAS